MKIAMLSIHSNPIGELGTNDTGGMSVYIRELAHELGRHGHWIDIYTRLNDGGHRPVIPLFKNVRLIHVNTPHAGNLSRLAFYPHLMDFFRSMEEFKSRMGIDYDVIHSHYWLSGQLGIWAQQFWNRPHVAMLHTLAEVKNRTGACPLEPELRIDAERQLIATCDRVIAPTEREKDNLIHFYGAREQNIGIVPCGVNLDLFRPGQQQAARTELGFSRDDVILLSVARFDPLKGIDKLLEAMSLLRNHEHLRLVIVGGDGDEAPESRFLKQKAVKFRVENRVAFAGRIEQRNLPFYYAAADALVIASCYESFGLVGLEALACGRPVVSTPVGAMESLINKSGAGYVVRDASPEALASGIRRILIGSGMPTAAAIRRSIISYGWSNVAAEVIAEYETAIHQCVFENEHSLSVGASCG